MLETTTSTAAEALRARRDEGARGADRRAGTRRQICAAANILFVREGFASATMEQIARAAGIRRSTLYTHFADKEQILDAIGTDYILDICEAIRRLPGPRPSTAQIHEWIAHFAAFVASQPGPAELILAAARGSSVAAASVTFGETMLRTFAEQLPAFRMALEPGQGFVRAWANATIAELGAAVMYQVRHGQGDGTHDRLAVAAMLLDRFIRQER